MPKLVNNTETLGMKALHHWRGKGTVGYWVSNNGKMGDYRQALAINAVNPVVDTNLVYSIINMVRHWCFDVPEQVLAYYCQGEL